MVQHAECEFAVDRLTRPPTYKYDFGKQADRRQAS